MRSITNLDGAGFLSLTGKQKSGTTNAFEFDNDNHRSPKDLADNPAGPWVARGWILEANNQFTEGGAPNDFLLVGTSSQPIPEPGTMVLFGAAVIGFVLRRRRRNSA